MRAWGNHMVHHAIYYKQNYSYAGVIEALSGAPFDVRFISFDDIRQDPDILKDIDVILNVETRIQPIQAEKTGQMKRLLLP